MQSLNIAKERIKMKKCLVVTTVLALVAVLAAGCAGVPTFTTPAPAEDEVNFRLLISDENNDIGHFDELWVTVSTVGVVQSGDGDGVVEQTIDPPAEVDLTKLTEENATELWSGKLPDEEYTKVFLYVDEITWVPAEGMDPEAIEEVKLPSEKMQISKPFTISSENGQVVNFVFDITVIKAGGSGKYILKPQLAQSGPDQAFNEVALQGNKERNKERNKELNLEIVEEDIAPGDTVTLRVTSGDEDVAEATVKVNGVQLEEHTGEDGTITFTIPEDADELEIEAGKGKLEGELRIELE
jgi:hypothetical protein